MKWKIDVDPSIAHLVGSAPDRWATEGKKTGHLIPIGTNIIDQLLYGFDFNNGALYTFQGQKKNRKTTVVVNWIKNLLVMGHWPEGWRIAVDLAESGLPPEKYADMLICLVATEILIRWHFQGKDYPTPWLLKQSWPQLSPSELLQAPGIGLDFKYLRHRQRTPLQQLAIEEAVSIVGAWPMDIFSPVSSRGATRKMDAARQRWQWCIDDRGVHLIVYDHVQQLESGASSDYNKMEEYVPLLASVVVENPGLVFLAISQVSLTSVRDAQIGLGKHMGRGGSKLAEESNAVFESTYDGEAKPFEVIMEIVDSRDSATVKVVQPIEPNSGLLIGDARVWTKYD